MANREVKSKKDTSLLRKIITWALTVVTALTAIALLLTVGFKIAQIIQKNSLISDLSNETSLSFKGQFTKIKQEAKEYIDTTSSGLDLPEPAYTATYDSCYTDHNDGGWFAINYNYKCLVTYAAVVEVPKDSTLEPIINQFARPGSEKFSYTDDRFYGKLYYLDKYGNTRTGLLESNPTILELLPYDLPIIKENTYTSAPEVLAIDFVAYGGSDAHVVAYAQQDAQNNRKLIETTGNKSLDPEKTYIILQYDKQHFDKNIGCQIPEFIFCNSPI